jgi:hypothetical protein
VKVIQIRSGGGIITSLACRMGASASIDFALCQQHSGGKRERKMHPQTRIMVIAPLAVLSPRARECINEKLHSIPREFPRPLFN